MTTTHIYSLVLPAAGIGKRMAADRPKQYLMIHGKTVIEHTLENLLSHPQIGQIIVVLHADDTTFASLPIAASARIKTVLGGDERSDSVLAGLHQVDPSEQWVLVHDAARPCLHHDDLGRLLQLAEQGPSGGILACRVRDTMKRADPQHNVVATESREHLWHALTPQFFPLALLKQALSLAQQDATPITDEASAIERLGAPVKLVEGRASNIKITQPEDLQLASFYLAQLRDQQGQA